MVCRSGSLPLSQLGSPTVNTPRLCRVKFLNEDVVFVFVEAMLVSTSWLQRRLDQYRDDDMDLESLQLYIVELLKRDESLESLEATVRAELGDFLGEDCDQFVDDLFNEIRKSSGKSLGSTASSSSNKRSKDFSSVRDEEDGGRRHKKERRGDEQSAAGALDYGSDLPVAGMPFDPSAMATMMNQMMPGAFPPMTYDAAYSFKAQGGNTEEEADDAEATGETGDQNEAEAETPYQEEEEAPGPLQGEEEAGTAGDFEDSMRGQMDTGASGPSYGRGRGRGRGRGAGRTSFRGETSWRGGRGSYSTSYSSSYAGGRGGASSKYVKDGAGGAVISVSEPASVDREVSDVVVAETERDPDDLYGDIDDSRQSGAGASGDSGTPSGATAAMAEAQKKKFEEAKKLRQQNEGVLKQKESVIEAQVLTLRNMITKVDSSTEKGRGQLDILETKIHDLQNKLNDVRSERSNTSAGALEYTGGGRGGFRGGGGGRGRGRGRFVPAFRGRGRGRASSSYVRGGMARGSGSYVREQR